MSIIKRFIFSSLVVALLVATVRIVSASETATIANRSNKNVELFLKWSSIPDESLRITLVPGENRHVYGPDGAALYMRFNSTPGINPVREQRLRLITARTDSPNHPGYWSYFRNINPSVVGIFEE